jgi:hypothetical protein
LLFSLSNSRPIASSIPEAENAHDFGGLVDSVQDEIGTHYDKARSRSLSDLPAAFRKRRQTLGLIEKRLTKFRCCPEIILSDKLTNLFQVHPRLARQNYSVAHDRTVRRASSNETSVSFMADASPKSKAWSNSGEPLKV